MDRHRLGARGLLWFCVACCVALGLRSWSLGTADDAGGVGFGQFVWLLVATPSLMTIAGLAEVIRRLGRARAAQAGQEAAMEHDPWFAGLMSAFVVGLALLWVQQWLHWRGYPGG